MAINLLKNPDGTDGLEHWDVVQNGGDGWQIIDMPGPGDPLPIDAPKFFATSFELCLKKQVINLLDYFTKELLDDAPPVTVEDWYSCRTDCGAIYQITVCLLDENKAVMRQFKPGQVTLDPPTAQSWIKAGGTFSNYGPGLRYISFEDGGKDTKFWAGHYGVRVTKSSVTVAA